MTLKSGSKFKEQFTCGFKHDLRNLVNFHPTTQTSWSFFELDSFYPKYARFELQKYRWFIFQDPEQWCKIWIKLDLVVSKMAWGIGWTFIRALKSLKNCTLMGCFCPKHRMFQLENFRGIKCHDTEWNVIQNLKENWLMGWKMT